MKSPGHAVHPGDMLTAAFPKTDEVLRIVDIAQDRGNSMAALELYEELEPARSRPTSPDLLAKRKRPR
jgi:ribosome-associated heat shock protein Hsp15